MPGTWERCGAKPTDKSWHTCNRKAGHKGDHSDTKVAPATYWKQETKENQ